MNNLIAVASIPGPAPVVEERPLTTIAPARGWQLIDVEELWRFRELVYFLAWRDVKVRYKQTVLGAAWALLQPALMMVVFTIFFGRMAGVSSDGLPYPLFAYAGLLPWTFFATAIASAGNSVVGSERLITKIYFPRMAIPFAAVGAVVVDFVVALGLLLGLMLYYGVTPGLGFLILPIIFGIILLAALGVGTLLAALNVAYRDFRYVIPFLVQLWMFATPSVYMQTPVEQPRVAVVTAAQPDDRASDAGQRGARVPWRAPLALNPLTGLIAAFRAAALGGPVPWRALGNSSVCVGLLCLAGCLYFRKVEDHFADII